MRIIPTCSGSTPPVTVTLDEEHLQAGIDRMNLDSPLSAAEFLDIDTHRYDVSFNVDINYIEVLSYVNNYIV